MADFTCEPGKVLTVEETQDMLAYDEVGMPRPDRYNDVVFDGTQIQGAVYRCRTNAEQEEAEAAANGAKEAAAARAARMERVEGEKVELAAKQGGAGMLDGAVNTGRQVEGNTSVGAGADAGANTGGRAGDGASRKSDK